MVVRLSLAVAASILGSALMMPAHARPPTATVSPGYDARLIESRKALAAPEQPAVTTDHAAHRKPKARIRKPHNQGH